MRDTRVSAATAACIAGLPSLLLGVAVTLAFWGTDPSRWVYDPSARVGLASLASVTLVAAASTSALLYGVIRSRRVPPALVVGAAGLPALVAAGALRIVLRHTGGELFFEQLWVGADAWRLFMLGALLSGALLVGAALGLAAAPRSGEGRSSGAMLLVGMAVASPTLICMGISSAHELPPLVIVTSPLAALAIGVGAARAWSQGRLVSLGGAAVFAGSLSNVAFALVLRAATTGTTLFVLANSDSPLAEGLVFRMAEESAHRYVLTDAAVAAAAATLTLFALLVLVQAARQSSGHTTGLLVRALLVLVLSAGSTLGPAAYGVSVTESEFAATRSEPWSDTTADFTPAHLPLGPQLTSRSGAVFTPDHVHVAGRGPVGIDYLSEGGRSELKALLHQEPLDYAVDARLTARQLRVILEAAHANGHTSVRLIGYPASIAHVSWLQETPGGFRFVPMMRAGTGVRIDIRQTRRGEATSVARFTTGGELQIARDGHALPLAPCSGAYPGGLIFHLDDDTDVPTVLAGLVRAQVCGFDTVAAIDASPPAAPL